MNTNEKSKTVWPGARAARRRLLRITLVLLPLSLVIFALLVKDWKLNLPDGTEESRRHLAEWLVVLVAAIAVTFLVSLLPTVQRFFGWLFSRRVIRKMLIGIGLAGNHGRACFMPKRTGAAGTRGTSIASNSKPAARNWISGRSFPNPFPTTKTLPPSRSLNPGSRREPISPTKWADNYSLASTMLGSETNPPAPEGNSHQGGKRYFLDLVAWKMAFDAIQAGQTNSSQQFASGKLDLASRAAAAPAVLADLASSETELDQLRAASDRPYARYPVVYDLDNPWGILLPHLGNIKRTVQRLQLRACAELAAGRSDDALADVKLMLYLADSVKNEPFLISYLVRLACCATRDSTGLGRIGRTRLVRRPASGTAGAFPAIRFLSPDGTIPRRRTRRGNSDRRSSGPGKISL